MKRLAGLLALLFLIAGCAGQALQPGEGFLQAPGGPVWYRVFGSGKATPLLMVHGGPGLRSCYMERLAEIIAKTRPVILYDQLGGGRSGRPMDPSLWNVERFVRELAAVRRDLDLHRLHLLGHSWGTALIAEYVAQNGEHGIQSIAFASPYFSSRQWALDADSLRAQLPAEVRETLQRHERTGDTETQEYRDAVGIYNARHLFHVKPEPIASCAQAPRNDEIYARMWGPTDFYATGVLKDLDVSSRLPTLKMPVLFVTGRYDMARPETAEKYRRMVRGASLEILENSGHVGPMEEPEAMARILERFLDRTEHQANR